MAPLTQATLAAILLFLGTSMAVPIANPGNEFTFKFGNTTSNKNFGCTLEKGTVEQVTFGPADFEKCVALGNTFNALIPENVGTKPQQQGRCFTLSPNSDCTGGSSGFLLGEAVDEGDCEKQSPFAFLLYTDVCPS